MKENNGLKGGKVLKEGLEGKFGSEKNGREE